MNRRSFLNMFAAVPVALPAMVKAASSPVITDIGYFPVEGEVFLHPSPTLMPQSFFTDWMENNITFQYMRSIGYEWRDGRFQLLQNPVLKSDTCLAGG